jgi:hypothetical protein
LLYLIGGQMQIDDARAIAILARQIAKKSFMAKLKSEGKRISLTPMPLVRLQREWLEQNAEDFYAQARRKWEAMRADFEPRTRTRVAHRKAVSPTGPKIGLG